MTPAASSGSVAFNFASFNATPNTNLTVMVTGIYAGMSESLIAQTICTQASNAFFNAGILFQGVLGILGCDQVSGYWQTANTEHVTSFFTQAQSLVTEVSDSTGAIYYIDTHPVLCTYADATTYGPLANQLFQSNAGSGLGQQQIIDLLSLASADLVATCRNNIVSCYYVYYMTTTFTNAIQFDNRPIQFLWNPYVLRPTIIAMATQIATFDLLSRYEIDYNTGWCTFRFAQDLLFNYEGFDWLNQWRVAYQAGWNYIARFVKLTVLQLSYQIQIESNITSISDGNSKITYTQDKNTMRRRVFSTLKSMGYMQ